MKVTAKVTGTGDWWAIEVPEVHGVFTQAKRLDQVEGMVQDAVAMMTDTPRGAVEVEVLPVLQHTIGDDLRRARDLAAQAATFKRRRPRQLEKLS